MTLIVETGSGLSNSESYCSVSFADTYFSDRGNTSWAALNTSQKEVALRSATDFLTENFRDRWRGLRTYTTQALDWPRTGVVLDQYTIVNLNSVPIEIQRACAVLAFKSISSPLTQDVTPFAIRKKVGELEVEYDRQAQNAPAIVYKQINNMLTPFLKGSGVSIGLERA